MRRITAYSLNVVLLVCLSFCDVQAKPHRDRYASEELNDESDMTKAWYVEYIHPSLPISPLSLVIAIFCLYNFYNALFVDPVYALASHILISGEDAKKQLKDMKREIGNDVKKFQALAGKHSACPSGKQAGGSLGKFGRGAMAPPFDRAVFDEENKIGTTIGPIETQFGWHLIYIHERRVS